MKNRRNIWRHCWIVALLAAGTVAVLVAGGFNPQPVQGQNAGGSQTPSWELPDVEGEPVAWKQFEGKAVLLDFWATWCPPCRAEIPGFIELQKEYKDEGLVVIGISLDQKGPSVVKDFIKEYGINYPIVMGNKEIADKFGGIRGIPTTFIINPNGEIVGKHVGYADKSWFEKRIKPLLPQS